MEEFPRSLREFDEQFATEQACRDYLFRLRWPEGFRCPRCSGNGYWPVRSVLLECSKMWPPDLGDSRHDLSGHAQAADRVVSRDVLGYDPEERGQCPKLAAGARTEELQDRLDLAAQVASRYGPAGTQPADGAGRGGRDLCWRAGPGQPGTPHGTQNVDCNCRARGWARDRADSHAPHPGRLSGKPDAVHKRSHRAR